MTNYSAEMATLQSSWLLTVVCGSNTDLWSQRTGTSCIHTRCVCVCACTSARLQLVPHYLCKSLGEVLHFVAWQCGQQLASDEVAKGIIGLQLRLGGCKCSTRLLNWMTQVGEMISVSCQGVPRSEPWLQLQNGIHAFSAYAAQHDRSLRKTLFIKWLESTTASCLCNSLQSWQSCLPSRGSCCQLPSLTRPSYGKPARSKTTMVMPFSKPAAVTCYLLHPVSGSLLLLQSFASVLKSEGTCSAVPFVLSSKPFRRDIVAHTVIQPGQDVKSLQCKEVSAHFCRVTDIYSRSRGARLHHRSDKD